MIFKDFVLASLSVLLIIACSIGFSEESKNERGKYDFSNYFFHENLNIDGGEIEYTINYDSKNRERSYRNTAVLIRNNDVIEPRGKIRGYFYKKNAQSIEQHHVRPNGVYIKAWKRYVNVGDKLIEEQPMKFGIADDCIVKNHLEEFDMGKTTRANLKPNKIYKDVIHIYCESKVITKEGIRDYWHANKYYAHNVGLVAMEGDWMIQLGPFYAIVDY